MSGKRVVNFDPAICTGQETVSVPAEGSLPGFRRKNASRKIKYPYLAVAACGNEAASIGTERDACHPDVVAQNVVNFYGLMVVGLPQTHHLVHARRCDVSAIGAEFHAAYKSPMFQVRQYSPSGFRFPNLGCVVGGCGCKQPPIRTECALHYPIEMLDRRQQW